MVKPNLRIIDDLRLEETLTPFISSEKGRYVSLAILVLAVILLLWSLVDMVRGWRADYLMSHQPAAARGAISLAAETTQIDKIPEQHIFGYQATEDTDFLPITSSKLHLTGIIQNPDNNLSRVIISEAGQTGKIYSIGDEVISGIKINAINTDSVVLEHNGRFEKLPLVRSPLLFKEKPESLWQHD